SRFDHIDFTARKASLLTKKLILAGFFVQKTIPLPLLRSNALGTGITVEVKTRKQVFIHQK
ncbi:MAG: hypothetical protein KJ985_01705, partial [Proteobacteria bacterium]|nr:hypothetical protein [Pseudomonadota bacterium]